MYDMINGDEGVSVPPKGDRNPDRPESGGITVGTTKRKEKRRCLQIRVMIPAVRGMTLNPG